MTTMTTTLSPSTQAVDAAIERLTEAHAQATAARQQADAARVAASSLQSRLRAGDSTVSVADIVNAGPTAERLEAMAAVHEGMIPDFEAAVRQARTDEVLDYLSSGQVLTHQARAEKRDDLVRQLVELVEPFELTLDPTAERHRKVTNALGDTTAYGRDFEYRHGSPHSPIQVGDVWSYEVNGQTYSMDLGVGRMVDDALTAAARELSKRRDERAKAK